MLARLFGRYTVMICFLFVYSLCIYLYNLITKYQEIFDFILFFVVSM